MTNHPLESAVYTQNSPPSSSWLRTLDEIDGTDLPLVGGKAFRLARLRQHGLHVPPGLVLTTTFFETQLQHHHLIPLWAGSPDVAVTPEALSWLADVLKTKPLSKELARALNEYLNTLSGIETDSFAVRSSAIDEDQRDHTFAGVHLTELGVPRSALPIAISRCWASAISQPAIEYRQDHGMSIQGIRVAVLIQPMLNPKSAGVGFTANPLTGARDELVVEATWGLGEAVVSSNVQPYCYKLANQPPDYPLNEQINGNVSPPDNEKVSSTGPLSKKELTELATQLEQIHALMGEPQDVEWAQQDEIFFFLQTRPVALPPPPAQTLNWMWTRGSHPEFLPELPSPLFGSLLERTQNRVIVLLKEAGLAVDELGPYVKLILGRPYLNLTFLKRIITQVGIAPGNLLFTIGHTEPGSAGGWLSIDWDTVWKSRRTYWRILKQILGLSRTLEEFQALVDEVGVTLNDINPDTSATTLLNHLRLHDRIYNELFNTNFRLAIAVSSVTALGSSLIAPLTPSPATFMTTLALKGVKTVDGALNQALFDLGRLARSDAQTTQYLANAADSFADYPDHALISTAFKQGFAELLVTYGQRATYETDMGWPRYQDDPAPLLRIIRQYAQSDVLVSNNDTSDSDSQSPDREAIGWRQLSRQAKGLNRLIPWRQWLATPCVKLLRRLLSMRDEVNSARAKAMTACRYWDLALGQKWAGQGWLAQPEDIFWLTLQEIERTLMVEENMGITLPATVQARKETYQTYAETTMPFTLRESQIASIQLGVGFSPEPTSDVMVGLPISPGQARGTVVVLNSPDDFKESSDDIILVMPSTDPAWLPLLRLATGLIVEMGGLLSHGSVIAREYGLPAVANIPDATRRFHTGDTVLVDGSTGVVQLLETTPAPQPQKENAG